MSQALANAKTAIANGQYGGALDYLESAHKLAPHDESLTAYEAWVRYLDLRSKLGEDAGQQNLMWQHAVARKNCRKIIEDVVARMPAFDTGLYFIGRILLDEGHPELALPQFESAVYANPNNAEALRYLEQTRDSMAPVDVGIASKVRRWLHLGGASGHHG